jgi:hypothetical protein
MRYKQTAPTRTRFLCPVCQVLRPAQPYGDKLTLECGHSRPGLLPKGQNAISLEDLNTSLGNKLFPHVLEVLPAFVEHR